MITAILITTLLSGLLIGMLFGFLLQRGSVAHFNTIVGQFLFTNFTVLKIMLSAIIVGGVCIYALVDFNYIAALPSKNSSIIGSAVGGVIFGIGMTILGYCPGTALAALGNGALDAAWGILGMFVGVIVFERAYTTLKMYIITDIPTNITLAQIFGISPWIILGILTVFTVILAALLKRYKL